MLLMFFSEHLYAVISSKCNRIKPTCAAPHNFLNIVKLLRLHFKLIFLTKDAKLEYLNQHKSAGFPEFLKIKVLIEFCNWFRLTLTKIDYFFVKDIMNTENGFYDALNDIVRLRVNFEIIEANEFSKSKKRKNTDC